MLRVELAVATPAFLDLTFVGLEALPAPGEERFAGELIRSPGGGAITAVAAARLGLDTALVAPIGDDLGGEYVRREVERDGVAVAGFRTKRTPETVIMPIGEQRTMVTVDPGIRARGQRRRGADAGGDRRQPRPARPRARTASAPTSPAATTTRARFAGNLPKKNVGARAIFLNVQDACVLTATGTAEDAAAALAGWIETVVVIVDASRVMAIAGGERGRGAGLRARPGGRHDRRPRPAVRGVRVGRPARRAAARADRLGAALLAARDGRPDRGRRRGHARSGSSRKARSTGSPGPPEPAAELRPATAADDAAMAEVFLAAGRAAWGFAGEAALAAMRAPVFDRGEIVAVDPGGVVGFVAAVNCEIDLLYTHPRAWGRGVGRLLLDGGRGGPARVRLHRGDAVDRGAQRAPAPRLRGGRLADRRRGARAAVERSVAERAAIPEGPAT